MKFLCVLLFVLGIVPMDAFAVSPDAWFITPREARTHLPRSTVLDVRSKAAFSMGRIPGSVHVTWEQFSQPKGPNHGELLPPDRLQEELRKVGVSNQIPVVVIGDGRDGWGEEGRIVWMLRAMGHKRAAAIDGGMSALKKAGIGTSPGLSGTVERGLFKIEVDSSLIASGEDVLKAMKQPRTILVDTRELREYQGSTPYGESRGGHVPSSKHLHFKDLMDKDGFILRGPDLAKKLDEFGITTTTPVIAYCTGGIRSAWLVAVLQQSRFTASNYAGSMWHWASLPASTHPLEKVKK